MICLVDNGTKSTSSRVIIYAFRKIVLVFFKILPTIQTMENCLLFVILQEGNSKGEKSIFLKEKVIY